ncbi:MAG: hypothetical protein ACHQYQ_02680, partial [Bacteriovoracales bacterium]
NIRQNIKVFRQNILIVPNIIKPATPSGSVVNGLSDTKVLPLAEDIQIADCEVVKTGYSRAGEILVDITELEDKIDLLTTKAQELAADPQSTPESINEVLEESGDLVDNFTLLSEELIQVYPPSYSDLDRIIEYRWNLQASAINYPDNNKWYLAKEITIDELSVPGYEWNKSMSGSLDESMRLPSPPETTEKRVVVFRRFASPSEACLSDFNVNFKGVIKVREPVGDVVVTPPIRIPNLPRPIPRINPLPHRLTIPIVNPVIVRPPVIARPPVIVHPLPTPEKFEEKEYVVTFNSDRPLPLIELKGTYASRLAEKKVTLESQLVMAPVIRELSVPASRSVVLNPVIRNTAIFRPVVNNRISYRNFRIGRGLPLPTAITISLPHL